MTPTIPPYRRGGGFGSLGVRFPIGRRTFLFPEIVLLAPRDMESRRWQARVLQGGIGIQWGGERAVGAAHSPP